MSILLVLSFFSLPSLLSLFLLSILALTIYRLYLHPLSHIPGPPLASLTTYYEAYHNIILSGQFLFEIQRLHTRYGPVIRIGPNEVHVDDPAFYDVLYCAYGRWDKSKVFVDMFDNTDSAFGTVGHGLHRQRRKAFQNFFSRRNISALEPRIATIIGRLCKRLEEYKAENKIVPLRDALECLTYDVVMDVVLAIKNEDGGGKVGKDNFCPELHETIKMVGKSGHYMKLIPWAQVLAGWAPKNVLVRLVPAMRGVVELQEYCKLLASSITSSSKAPPSPSSPSSSSSQTHPTVCHEIHACPTLPLSEKTPRRLQHEIETFVIAGTETTAHALACVVFHVLDNPVVEERLRRELGEKGGCEGDWRTLEQLPYLTAVLLEGLRLSYGIATRLPRVAPDRVVVCNGFEIPPGTSISMSSMLMHHNESIFPDHLKFSPERWLSLLSGDEQKRWRLEKYLVNFSRGTRACVGINLAWAELYLTTAALFSRFKLELADTTRDDVTLHREIFTPQAKAESKGVRVWVRSVVGDGPLSNGEAREGKR